MTTGILGAIGSTPLVRLKRLLDDDRIELYAKLESLNPGGSMKDRPAAHMIRRALEDGRVVPGGVVIESSSGNMGIGLAQVCSYYGVRFICVVDPKTTRQNVQMLEAYGAEVDMVRDPDPETGEYLPVRLRRVQELLARIPGSVWCNQYANADNSDAHHETMREIDEALAGRVDVLVCATSTCGTLRGCAEYVRKRGLPTRIVAVDAIGSVIFGGAAGKRLIPGHGAAVRPALFGTGYADECVHVSDADCIAGCRKLVRREAILAGGSSGAVITAVERIASRLAPGSTCAAILADRGERYLDTIYSDEWVHAHCGDISHAMRETDAFAWQTQTV